MLRKEVRTLFISDLKDETYTLLHCTDEYITTPEFHQHDYYELYFYLSGDASIVIEEFSCRLEPGDVVLLPPDRMHRAIHHTEHGHYDRYIIYVTPAFLEHAGTADYPLLQLFRDAAAKSHFIAHPSGKELTRTLTLMNDLTSVPDSDAQQRLIRDYTIAIILARICGWFIQSSCSDATHTAHALSGVISYINAHLDADLSLDTLSSRFDINKYALLRLFKDYAQVTLHQYILQKRISRAKYLLLTGMPPSQVYAACGYYEYSSFYKAFKNQTGLTPQQFLRSAPTLGTSSAAADVSRS